MKFIAKEPYFKVVEFAGQLLSVPAWGASIGADSDGAVYVYSGKPIETDTGWYNSDFGPYQVIGYVDLEGADWRTTLKDIK